MCETPSRKRGRFCYQPISYSHFSRVAIQGAETGYARMAHWRIKATLDFAWNHPLTAFRKPPEGQRSYQRSFSGAGPFLWLGQNPRSYHRCFHRCLSLFLSLFSGGSPATGHRGYHRGLAGFSAGFSSILRKRVCCPFHGHAGTVSEASAPAPTRPGPFLSEIPQNPRLFWVASGETPQPRRSPLGLNKAQHGAAATVGDLWRCKPSGGRCKCQVLLGCRVTGHRCYHRCFIQAVQLGRRR